MNQCYNVSMLKIKVKIIHPEILLGIVLVIGFILNSSITLDAVAVYVDGQKIEEEFYGDTQEEIVSELENNFNTGLESDNYHVLNDLDTDSATKDDVLSLATEKQVNIKINNEIKQVSTYAINIAELKYEMKLTDVDTNYSDITLLTDIIDSGSVVEFAQEVSSYDYKEYIAYDIEYIEDDTLLIGEEKIVTFGSEGYNEYKKTEVIQNSIITDSKEMLVKTVKPTTQVVRVGTKENSVDWNSVAQCESSGDWSADTGNGYYGGLQIAKSTWDAYSTSAGVNTQMPNQASMSEQIAVAELILSAQGENAWGNCL